MKLTAGSFLWLASNDLKLNWRRFTDFLGDPSRGKLMALLMGGTILLHLLALPAAIMLSPLIHTTGDIGAKPSVLLASVLICALTWLTAQSLFGTARALYDRGDLDLLLGSPIPPARVFAAKAAAIALSSLGSIAFLTLPVANVGMLIDGRAWFGCYPLLIGYALMATAVGLTLSIALFFGFGPRRARLYTQLTGAFIGGAFVLVAQILAMLPAPVQASLKGWLEGQGLQPGSISHAIAMLPVRAVRGDIPAMLIVLSAGLALFATAVGLLGDRFARASLAAAGAPSGDKNMRRSERRFRGGLERSLRRKEWLLLARDPNLFAQLGLQIIYTVPVAVVLMRSEALPVAMALAPTIVVVAAQVAASLAWLTVSGEDAPELIATAPVDVETVDRAKLGAIALPVATILALPTLGLALISWPMAAATAVFAAAAAASTALLNFWHPMPGNRRGMLRRHSQSKLVGLVEHVLAILWAVAIMFLALGTQLLVVPITLVFIILMVVRSRRDVSAPRIFSAKPKAKPEPVAPEIANYVAVAGERPTSRA